MASITCRNGETFPNTHTHHSVAAVRQCQGAPSQWPTHKPSDRPAPLNHTNHACRIEETVRAREHLSKFAPKLAAGLGYGVTGTEAMANAENLTKTLATFKGRREPATSRVDPELEAKVLDGRYGIEQDGVTKFYQVRKVTQGKWAGRTFVDRQAGDENFPVRFGTERAKILAAIAADVKAAAIRYGKELGQCSQCGRTLTNPDSIKAGIGPVCLSRLGG